MDRSPSTEHAWVAGAVRSLNNVGSWTGRIHVHKLLFITKVLDLAKPPFRFELYQYGPYSFELDSVIAEMEAFGQLAKTYAEPGYGPRYALTPSGKPEAARLDPADAAAIDRVGKAIGPLGSRELELRATCLWVQRREGVKDEARIVSRVLAVKPQYSETQVRTALAQTARLVASLAPTGPT
jgi:uncharacterized protein YwgA